jgi:hypothetical protein
MSFADSKPLIVRRITWQFLASNVSYIQYVIQLYCNDGVFFVEKQQKKEGSGISSKHDVQNRHIYCIMFCFFVF